VFGALLGLTVGSGLGAAMVHALKNQGVGTLAPPWAAGSPSRAGLEPPDGIHPVTPADIQRKAIARDILTDLHAAQVGVCPLATVLAAG
jgi:hypothetical protein